ncbi:argininosuccinate lyase [Bosea sp. OK403]|uniref:argininosuccinate lyase n=1 Tax=Bosea sp. OK403 TaxID=1855286 RepID=UPI0008E2860C|nr:argininosuccinate lyase [Bosea sp. OK403]SFI11920.1 argininosuccinate lyase [Bosea sp. OK403]
MNQPLRLWGGRFTAEPDPALTRLSRSEASDFSLAPYDLAGSRAHIRELGRAGLLDNAEIATIQKEIDAVEKLHAKGLIEPWPEDEDVQTFLERVLTQRLGPLGGKIRAGRSRNDQAANDLKLFLRHRSRGLMKDLLSLQEALIAQAREHVATPAPGVTHLQAAQPITFGHHLMAHAQAFARDAERLIDWDRRNAVSPLGAAALAGSAIALNPELVAEELGYDGSFENSVDAVGSRDHVAEFLFVTAMHAVNLSRLAEEIVIWCTQPYRWISLHDSFATGSSIMPQKKNPDIAELTRGRSARLIGGLMTMLAALKSLPLSYNRDLAEDKNACCDAVEGLALALPAMAGLVATMTVNVATMRDAASRGFTLATEVADFLARRGVAFSEAHEITGALVRLCEEKSCQLHEIDDAGLASVDPRLTPDIREHLTLEAALDARMAKGGTSPARVAEQIDRLTQRLAVQRDWANGYRGPQP